MKIYWNRHVLELIRASGICTKLKGPVPKFTCSSTVTASQSPSEGFVRSCFSKKLIRKILQKIHPKETIIEVLFSVTSQPATSLKKNPITVIFFKSHIFLWLLKRFFRMLFCVRALVKQQKELKYSSAYILEKSWSEEFHKIHPKEAMVDSFFS